MMGSEVEAYTAPEVERAPVQVVNEHTDGWIRVLQPVAELASQVAGTEFVPLAIRQKPAAITAAILFGRELDMPPMQALSQVHVVEGRPSLSAEHMRAMVLAAGHELSYDLSVPMQVTATGRRRIGWTPNGTPAYGNPTSVTWSIAMAERAGLVGKTNWRKHPRQMLEARATAELCRLIFADVTHGLPTLEELEDGGAYDDEATDAPATPSAPSGRSKVSRRPRAGTGKAADGPAPVTPVQGSVPSAPRPPLPSAPSGPVASEAPAGGSGPATGEPPAAAPDAAEEVSGDSGPEAPSSEGDGSADDVAATGDDRSYMQARFAEAQEAAQEVAEAEIVPEIPEGIHPGQKRAVEAAFGSLGLKDRAEIHHAVSAMLGRRVTTLGAAAVGEDGTVVGLTAEDGSRLLNALSKLRDRADLEDLIRTAAEQWEAHRDA